MKIIKIIYNKFFFEIRNLFTLENRGERVDIKYSSKNNFNKFNIYQKSHYKRYEFAYKDISENDIVGDMACGTGYGSALLSNKAKEIIAVDISKETIKKISKRYNYINKIKFICLDLLNISYNNYFDKIISFETIEHLEEDKIIKIFSNFYNALKPNGSLIFSVPYMQKESEQAIKMGFHKTFLIDEEKIKKWLKETNFELFSINYQNYKTHEIKNNMEEKDFLIITTKKSNKK